MLIETDLSAKNNSTLLLQEKLKTDLIRFIINKYATTTYIYFYHYFDQVDQVVLTI